MLLRVWSLQWSGKGQENVRLLKPFLNRVHLFIFILKEHSVLLYLKKMHLADPCYFLLPALLMSLQIQGDLLKCLSLVEKYHSVLI
jgi:hypothetical protein